MAKATLRIEKYIARKHITMLERLVLAKYGGAGVIQKSAMCYEFTNFLDNFQLVSGSVLCAWTGIKAQNMQCIMVAVDFESSGEEVWNYEDGWL